MQVALGLVTALILVSSGAQASELSKCRSVAAERALKEFQSKQTSAAKVTRVELFERGKTAYIFKVHVQGHGEDLAPKKTLYSVSTIAKGPSKCLAASPTALLAPPERKVASK